MNPQLTKLRPSEFIPILLDFSDNILSSKIYQAWGAGRSKVSSNDKKDVCAIDVQIGKELTSLQLKAAKQEGRLSEALLDRRAKLKR